MHSEINKIIENFEYLYSNSEYIQEIEYLMIFFNFSKNQIIEARCSRDLPEEFKNENYNNELSKFIIHLHNIMPWLWHKKRQKIVLDYIQDIKPNTICEIWYWTPQKYIKDYVIKNNIKTLLCDIDSSSSIFSSKLLSFWDKQYQKNISFEIHNMDYDNLPEWFELYIMQDSIEHVINPTKTLNKYVEEAKNASYFLFSLPLEIENPVPQHNIYWKTKEEIIDWLKLSWLRIIKYEEIKMNLQNDIFAINLHKDFREIVFLCQK